MPRLENTGILVDKYYEKTGGATSTFDLCCECTSKYKGSALVALPLAPYYSHEPLGILEGEVDHPDYDEVNYKCELCGKPLTSRDN